MVILIILAAFAWEPNAARQSADEIGQTHKSELDPVLGQLIPLGDSLKGLKPADRVLVVGIAVCSECASIKADVRTIGRGFARVIGVFQGDRAEYRGKTDTDYIESFDTALFWKPSQFSSLNATWVPRAYVVDGNGMLLDKQPPNELLERFVARGLR